MKIQNVPSEFRKMSRNMTSGLFDLVETEDDAVAHALIGFDLRDAEVLRSFLAEIVAPENSAEDLKQLWSSVPSGVYFSDGEELRRFLQSILSAVRSKPYLT